MDVNDAFANEMLRIRGMLADGKIEEIRKLRQTNTFISLLGKSYAEIITTISSSLDDEHVWKCAGRVKCCEELFSIVVDEVHPENYFITVLEQFDEDTCCLEKFRVLLNPLFLMLQKLSSSREFWLEWTLSTIINYLDNLPFPEDHEVEFEEKKIVTRNHYVESVIKAMEKLGEFYESLIKVCNTSLKVSDALIIFGFQVLSGPVKYVYIEKSPELTIINLKICDCIDLLIFHVYHLFDWLNERSMTDSLCKEDNCSTWNDADTKSVATLELCDKVSAMQLSLYYFFKVPSNNAFQAFPFVYDKLFLFHKILFLSVTLLQHTHNAIVRKGLLLAERILISVDNDSIPHYYLELKVHQEFLRVISSISVYSYIFENRQLAVKLLLMYFSKFDAPGTYLLYLNVFSVTGSPDIDGEIISSFRRRMYLSFSNDCLEYYQKGKLLMDLLKRFSHLKNNADIDLLKCKNEVISTLHLFVLIFGRDTKNETSIRDYFEHFEENYFNVVKLAVVNTRANLEKETQALMHNPDEFKQPKLFDVVVDGKTLPQPKMNEKIEATKSDLTGLAIIEGALDLVYKYVDR